VVGRFLQLRQPNPGKRIRRNTMFKPSLLLVVPLLSAALPALASDLAVNINADEFDGTCDAHCSLRDAVQVANQTSGPHLILLPAGVYELTRPTTVDGDGIRYDEDLNQNGDLDVLTELTIRGKGSESSVIRGLAGNDRLLEALASASLNLQRLALEGGSTNFNGGAVENHNELTLRKVRVHSNRAETLNPQFLPLLGEEGYRFGQGGGIANYGQLEVYASTFSENRSRGNFDNNLGRGGAIFNRGTLLVRESTFTRNQASDEMEFGAGAGIYNRSQADVARSLFVGNRGAEGTYGLAIGNANGGVLKLTNSTLSGHYGTPGALTNGSWYEELPGTAKATLVNVTIAGNSGYGLTNAGEIRIRNSLIAGNLGIYEDEVTNCRNLGEYQYQAIGLLLNSEPSNCTADQYLEFAKTFTHLLYPLADYGGPTHTYALRKGSLAVDTGIGSCTSHDQRGLTRPRDGDGDGVAICDLGAYERAKP